MNMKNSLKIISAAFLLAVFPFASWHAPAADAAAKTMWRMEQTQATKGKVTVFFTDDAIKFSTDRGGQYISRAPDWDVHAFRLDDKTICHLTRKAFYSKMAYRPNRWKEFKKVGMEVICSRPANVLSNKQHLLSVADFPGIPPEVGDFICSWLRLPGGGGVLMKCVSANPTRKKKVQALVVDLDRSEGNAVTTKSVQQVPYNKDVFKLPTGFRTVKRLEDTYYSAAGRNELESIVEQLGVGEGLGKNRKP